jgi:hypothetical protein
MCSTSRILNTKEGGANMVIFLLLVIIGLLVGFGNMLMYGLAAICVVVGIGMVGGVCVLLGSLIYEGGVDALLPMLLFVILPTVTIWLIYKAWGKHEKQNTENEIYVLAKLPEESTPKTPPVTTARYQISDDLQARMLEADRRSKEWRP